MSAFPIYTTTGIKSLNNEPFERLSQYRPGIQRTLLGHVKPNPRAEHSWFIARLAHRRLEQRMWIQHGKAAYRDYYKVTHYEYAICCIDWRTGNIAELSSFTTLPAAIAALKNNSSAPHFPIDTATV